MDKLKVKTSYLKELSPLSKTYRKGDSSDEIIKIKEWLIYWQLNENYVSKVITLDTGQQLFDETTETILKQVQKFLGLTPTGEVDPTCWQCLVSPLKKAMSLEVPENKSLGQRMRYFATKHLQYRSAELEKNNLGPWVRSYMDGAEGTLAYWCQAFATVILDQAFSSMGKNFTDDYVNTDTCETMRVCARKNNLLCDYDSLKNKTYIPQVGDLVLYIFPESNKAHHTEIIYEVLDSASGSMLTIGGNTNLVGSRDGVGVFMVDRNFLTQHVDVVKMVTS